MNFPDLWSKILVPTGEFLILLGGVAWAVIRFRVEGRFRPRIEFDIDCNFLGPQNDSYISEFRIRIHNKGALRREFRRIVLRVRGIRSDESIEEWERREPRVHFPLKIFEANVIAEDYGYVFVEPGVSQTLTFVTM